MLAAGIRSICMATLSVPQVSGSFKGDWKKIQLTDTTECFVAVSDKFLILLAGSDREDYNVSIQEDM